MKRSLIVAALMATTCLTPRPVHAAPVVGFVAGTLGVASGAAIASTAAYAAGAAFGGSILGGFVVKTAIAIGLSAIAARLQRQSFNAPQPSSRMTNVAQPITYVETVYGRVRKGGPVGFTGFRNLRRYWVPILAAHSISGIVEHWLDERVVTLSTEADKSKPNIIGGPLTNRGRIEPFTGGAGQVANSYFLNTFSELTPAHDFKGLSGAYLFTGRPSPEDFSRIFPTGRHWSYAPVFDGNDQIYDPRTQATGYTNNSALIMAHWLTEKLGQEVDWYEVATEADVCDELVTNKEGGTQPRWTTNGTISDDQEYEDQRALLAGSCDAFIYERVDGKVGFKVGRWIEPTITLGPDDFYSLELVDGNWGPDAPTEVAGTYVEPENAWRETPSGVWVEETGTRRIRNEPALFMVNNHNQCSRINKRMAKVARAKYRLSGTLGPIGYELLGGDNGGAHRFFRVEHPELGISQYFEIGELTREGVATFSLSANSVNETDFDFNAAIEEPDRPKLNEVVNNDDIPDVTGFFADVVNGGALEYSWDDQDESFTQQVRIREAGETDWQVYTVPEGQTHLRITGLVDGVNYEAQARNRTAALRSGDWTPTPPYENAPIVNTTPPAALTDLDLSYTVDAGNLEITVTFIPPNDPNYFGTNIYKSVNGGSLVKIRTEYGIPAASDSWTDVFPVASATYRYFAAPINPSGVEGPLSGPVTQPYPDGPP